MARKYPKDVPLPKLSESPRLLFPIRYNEPRSHKVMRWMLMPLIIILAVPFLLLVVLPYQLYTGESIFDRGRLL